MGLEVFVLIVALSVIAAIAIWTIMTGSPPTPTSPKVRSAIIGILPSRLPTIPNGRIYELGAGWGGISRALAGHFQSNPIIGIEISPLPFAFSWLVSALAPKPNLKFNYGNFLRTDLSDAALVVCYLSREGLVQLTPKLERELEPEALILSHTFEIPGWQVLDKVLAPDLYRSPVYLYELSDAVAPRSQL